MNRTRVKLLSSEDATEIEFLFKEVWPAAIAYPEEWRRKRTLSREEIVKEMESGYYYFGVRMDGRIVGLYKASVRGDSVVGEHQSISPSYRRQGLALTMYRQIIDFAREKKCRRIHVNVLLDQVSSKKCVAKLGFHKKGHPYEQAKGMVVQMYEKIL